MSNDFHLLSEIDALASVGKALSTERDTDKLLEQILLTAKSMTRADGGTLYLVSETGEVRIETLRTDSLGMAMGGSSGNEVPFEPIALYDEKGRPNHRNVVTHAVLDQCTVNIADAYETERFDLSGTWAFDRETGYRSVAFLAVPMKDHRGDIIGVLQLLNPLDENGSVVPFSEAAQHLVEAFASQAAIALTNRRLIGDLEALLESLTHLIAYAIDEKSPYTGGHCRRVPEITMLLADAAAADSGPFASFELDEERRYELQIAAWLHDCGKLTTPEYIMDKATKLQTLFDRIELVNTRLDVLAREAEIRWLNHKVEAMEAGHEPDPAAERSYQDSLEELAEIRQFLAQVNLGSEQMSQADQQRVRELAQRPYRDASGALRSLLNEEEVYNLTINKGTLTPEERDQINHHMVTTIHMLESLPFPKNLRRVPELAGGHHERMDGKGFPRGLCGDQMSVGARIMAIADIFEALTAPDRPYKAGMKLSESLRILRRMSETGHLDPELFALFIRERIWERYAREHVGPEQLDLADAEEVIADFFEKSAVGRINS